MATIKLTNKQLQLIQKALDLYSRIGTLQLDIILDHPSIDNILDDQFTQEKELEVGDETMRGVITEIGDGFIKTKGHWGNGEEIKTWTDIEKIKLSPDWNEIHKNKDTIKYHLNQVTCLVSGENFRNGGNLGIYNNKVDKSCIEAFDMIKVIRHEFWKINPNRNESTVDSHVGLDNPQDAVKVQLDTVSDIRNLKLKKINNK